MKTPKTIQQRDTDFLKLDSLHYLADQNGLKVLSFHETSDGMYVSYLRPSLAREPRLVECRDAQEYDLKIAAWIKVCTMKSKYYSKFEDMVLGEIERLKEL